MTLDHGVERLIVGNCLSPNVSRVLREDFPHETSEQMVFTVFTELGEDGVFCGLVTSQEIAQQPNLNFGNLIKNREIHAVPPDASVFQALNTMIQEKLSALPVLNKLNKLVGVITHQSVIQTLTQCEQDCQSELRNLRIQFEIQEQLAKTRLAQLNKTLEDLTTKQGLDLIEVNLLQLGIEALTTLLQVRYGAIGILDESDESGETHKYFGHTGITPEIVNSIGSLPEGKGLLGAVIRENATIRLEDMSKDSRSAGFPPHHPSMKSLLAVPISFENRIYGRIYLSEKLNGLPFSEDEEKLVQNFSNSLATALNESFRIAILVREKALQLELTSKYKSEFLSNMSHELRTPLNNLLILSGLLAENINNHLDSNEVEFASLIHTSGNDLLSLINEILDLSKIESGRASLDLSELPFARLHEQIESAFSHVAESRKLGFEVSLAGDLPAAIITDEMRLMQVMKNMLSNAFKFTEKGQVSLRVDRATSGWSAENKSLNQASEVFAFTVEDTGIGISADKQFIIFEAFQQGDGGTARQYGGTGLGLSISREIARLLGGEFKLVRSTLQQGSAFALYVPQKSLNNESPAQVRENRQSLPSEQLSKPVSADDSLKLTASEWPLRVPRELEVVDDRATIKEGDRVLLIIEDDPIFAKILLYLAREKGFKGIVAIRGMQALELARSHKPDAITLDIHIPDLDGWTILDILKRDSELRHIPVDIISVEDDPLRGLSQGVLQYLTKPVSRDQLATAMDTMNAYLDRPMKNLLLVAADKDLDAQISDLLGGGDITINHVASGKAGLVAMSKNPFDCVVVAKKLSDMSGIDFIAALRKDKLLAGIPIVIFSGEPLTETERVTLGKLANSSVIKNAESLERLLDQSALFLHRVVSRLPEEKRKMLQQLQWASNNLNDKKVLIVDDDANNISALSAALERRGVVVLSAESGATAIDLLKRVPDIDLVLMDIMMPGMDGYETMREIRRLGKFKKLPIIALTGKAMVGDREKCLEAGASDYLSKPVNIGQLTSLMQVWLSR